jgi:hypothetical protein
VWSLCVRSARPDAPFTLCRTEWTEEKKEEKKEEGGGSDEEVELMAGGGLLWLW